MKTQLTDTLSRYEQEKGQCRIAAWLLHLTQSRLLSAGLRGPETGGVYSPPQFHEAVSGNLYIRWADGTVSMTSLTRPLVQDAQALISLMRDFAFDDPFAPEIPDPEKPANVKVFSPAVEELCNQKPSEILTWLEPAKETFRALDTENCMAEASCSVKNHCIAHSRGLDAQFAETETLFEAGAESLYSIAVSSREIIEKEEIRSHLKHLEEMIRIQRQKTEIKENIPVVILSPSVSQRFADKYLLENLNAEEIDNRRSAFRPEEFAEHRQRFHQTFGLLHNPCRTMHAGSYPLDRQGICAKPVCFIEKGRLENAQVSLRGARQTGWNPTPLATPDSLILQGSGEENLQDFIRTSENAYLITSVLGLHTQDSGRGDYSLAVPHGIVIREGEMIGSAKSILSGNYFDDLQKEIITLISPFHLFQGMAFQGRVY